MDSACQQAANDAGSPLRTSEAGLYVPGTPVRYRTAATLFSYPETHLAGLRMGVWSTNALYASLWVMSLGSR
jgi:hypothetical protein